MAFLISLLRAASQINTSLPPLEEASEVAPIIETVHCVATTSLQTETLPPAPKPLAAELLPAPENTKSLLPLTKENVDRLCGMIEDTLTASQKQQADSFLEEFKKAPNKEELEESIGMLNALLPEPQKSAEAYTSEIEAILAPLIVGTTYDLTKLNPETAIRLLKELQGKNFENDRYTRYKDRLENLILNTYVQETFKNINDPAQVKKAIELLSFSRSQNSTWMPYEAVLTVFINGYVEAQMRQFPRNPQERSLGPVGIKNTDGSSCFACAWMQLVANNSLLSAAYSTVQSPNFASAKAVLREYRVVQRNHELLKKIDTTQKKEAELILTLQPENIGKMRTILEEGGQQDASELMNRLNNEITFDANGKVGNVQLGAKIVKIVENFQRAAVTTTSLIPGKPYTFPLRELSFNPDEAHPTLSSMENSSDIAVGNGNKPIAETRHLFDEVPNLVVYQISRLSADPITQNLFVNRTEVDMPLYHTIRTGETRAKLQLQGFTRHLGGVSGGHYVSYIAHGGRFWLANDARVSEISAAEYLIAARGANTALYATVQKVKAEGKE